VTPQKPASLYALPAWLVASSLRDLGQGDSISTEQVRRPVAPRPR